MSARTSLLLGLGAGLGVLVLAVQPGHATITAVLPAVVKLAAGPASVELDKLESDTDISAFDEEQCVTAAVAVQTDQGWIPAGTPFSCHFFHSDPVTVPPGSLLTGRAMFDTEIIGVISTTADLDASDGVCGLQTTAYPTGVAPHRGFEPAQADAYQLLNPFALRVRMEVPSTFDQMRVLTCCPGEPGCDENPNNDWPPQD